MFLMTMCVFLGYGLDGVGYRLYDLVMKKLIRCCEAEFIEDQRLKDIDKVNVDDPTHDEDRENCHGERCNLRLSLLHK